MIFDVDGVLCRSEHVITEALTRMFRESYGVRLGPADFAPHVGVGERRFIELMGQKHGLQVEVERDKARTYAIYLDLIRGNLDPLAGVPEFIALCRICGLLLGVATSADRIKLEGNLGEIGLDLSLFTGIVTGCEIMHTKPAPDIFLEAARRMGLPPAACLVVEDAVNGVRAAKAAGCLCLGITTTFEAALLRGAGADWTAPDLAQIPDGLLTLIDVRTRKQA